MSIVHSSIRCILSATALKTDMYNVVTQVHSVHVRSRQSIKLLKRPVLFCFINKCAVQKPLNWLFRWYLQFVCNIHLQAFIAPWRFDEYNNIWELFFVDGTIVYKFKRKLKTSYKKLVKRRIWFENCFFIK